MAATYFGPEDPRPMAVISESYRDNLSGQLPELPPWEKYSLGDEYEQSLFTLLHHYMELGTTDTLCYVGDTRDFLIDRLEEHFCLLKPVQTVLPGRVEYVETKDHKMLPLNMPNVGAEEFFRLQVLQHQKPSRARAPVKFDKILVHDGCRYLTQPTTLYTNMMQCLAPGGILLILHRPAQLSTLPFFRTAQNRLADNDTPYMSIIKDLRKVPDVDVQWELESLPVRIHRRKWLAMVRDRYPPHMEMMSQTEVLGGLRELTEGVLKYEGDLVEFDDCLLFVKVTHSKRGKVSGNKSLQDGIQHQPSVSSSAHHNLKLTMTLPPKTKPPSSATSSASRPHSQSSFKFLWD